MRTLLLKVTEFCQLALNFEPQTHQSACSPQLLSHSPGFPSRLIFRGPIPIPNLLVAPVAGAPALAGRNVLLVCVESKQGENCENPGGPEH